MLAIAEFPIISISIIVPFLSAIYILLFVKQSFNSNKILYTKYVAILSSIMTLMCSGYLLLEFDTSTSELQFLEFFPLLKTIGLDYRVGLDGISVFFIFFTALFTLLCVVISLFTINKKIKEYLICFLFMESFLIGAFSSVNLLLFFIFFEATLIPVYLLIGIWGGQNRVYAAYKFFLYTFAGSILLLICVIYIYSLTNTLNMTELYKLLPMQAFKIQMILWSCAFVAFAIKLPIVPLHTWLPDAHVEAPTAGSVILAGILLKLGGYGLLRVCLPMFPDATLYMSKSVMLLGAVGIIYASCIACTQNDIKKTIAYSSIAHMGYVLIGVFSLNFYGIQGAVFQMISHSVISAALFMIVGVLYNRLHTREIHMYGGLIQKMPILSSYFFIAILGAIGVPGTSGFIGELFCLLGTFKNSYLVGIIAVCGVLISAIYMLSLYRRVILGTIENPSINKVNDVDVCEQIAILPLVILILIIGVYPNYIMKILSLPSKALSILFIN